jgi:hypothetical protein
MVKELFNELNSELKADENHAQILIQISCNSKTLEKASTIVEGLGVRIIEMNILSSDFILLKLDVKDMRNIALKLTERGFSVVKGINALTQNV